MSHIVSTFRQRPKTAQGWRALWLGICALFLPTALGINAAVLVPMVNVVFGEAASRIFGFCIGIAALVLTIAAFTTGINALRMGERSWAVWIGFIPAALSVAFWLFMIVGEFIVPH